VRVVEHRIGVEGEVVDVDVIDGQDWIAVVRTRTDRQLVLFAEGTSIKPPRRLDFPIVRSAGGGRVLLADTRVDEADETNGYLVDSRGEVIRIFAFGDGIQDVLVSTDKIVVTYFDEGIFGDTPSPAPYGLAVFDFDGGFKFGWNSNPLSGDVEIDDCDCAARAADGRLFFYPYPNYLLIALDLATMTHDRWETPNVLHGSNALTIATASDAAFFHSPYRDGSGIYRWRIGAADAQRVGEHDGRMRGRPNGSFLSVEPAGYALLFPDER
jgi:hypothetical protein